MVALWVVFGDVVHHVGDSPVLVETILPLNHSTTKPMEVHVHRFKLLGDNGIVCEPSSGGVVGLDGSPWLGAIHFHADVSNSNYFFCCDEKSTKF